MTHYNCVILRCDLDEIDKNEFGQMKQLVKTSGVAATFFLLAHQFSMDAPVFFPKGMPEHGKKTREADYRAFITKKDRDDCNPYIEFALHSEAKPKSFTSANILELYAKNLIEQKERFKHYWGVCHGHSAHSDNAAIFINLEGNTSRIRQRDADIINGASERAAFRWVSCIKDIEHMTENNISFCPLDSPYRVGSTLVFPIGWDDNICYMTAKRQRLENKKILSGLIIRLDESMVLAVPLVVSFHPMRFLPTNDRFLYPFELIKEFVTIVRDRKIPILTFSQYWDSVMEI